MARYIDADKLVAWCMETFQVQSTVAGKAYIDAFLTAVLSRPTADVAPKSEVASMPHKCKDCAGCTQWKCDCSLIEDNAKTEVAREIFEEIEKYWIESDTLPDCARLVDLDKIAELKKKYTGEQT